MTNQTDKIQSPCVRNCCLNQDDICLGCFRSLSEIIAWGQASSEERELIMLFSKKRAEESKQISLRINPNI
jgi:uncharacterized protein